MDARDFASKVVIGLILFSCLFAQTLFVAGSQATQSPVQPAKKHDDSLKTEAIEDQRHTFAVSIIMSLADDARGYKDLGLRAWVLARCADLLWDTDPDGARILLRRAWETAEKADAAEDVGSPNSSTPTMVIALRRWGGGDSRAEVLNVATRRDQSLGDEFLAKLIATEAKAAEALAKNAQPFNDGRTTSEETSKRLSFAHRLLDENKADKAFEFALPALHQVNEKTISFLTRLRLVKPSLANKQFMRLLALTELDPAADANTVSGLSSYAFTPGFYVMFERDDSVRWTPALETIAAPNLSPDVRNSFFRLAAKILLRPLPPPDQDLTSSGLFGKYMVIKRLLPLFEQYTPDTAVALQSQLIALAEQASHGIGDEHFLLTQGIVREPDPGTVLDGLQERAAKAKNEREREAIYADAAAILAGQGNTAAQDIAEKIDTGYLREAVRRYVDISLLCTALAKKDVALALRFAKAASLDHVHRTWAYLQIAPLLVETDSRRALELLEEALAEAKRIDGDDTNRALLIIGVARQLLAGDTVRSWEVAAEGIKAANASEEFSGEANGIRVSLVTSSGLKLINLDTSSLSLSALLSSLAKHDLARATDLAKSLKSEGPRAMATLAAASSAIKKSRKFK